MFERYTEPARRSVFFARYEASQFGSQFIEQEHLLLGILREAKSLIPSVNAAAREQIGGQVEARMARRDKISTSVDLPLNDECRRAMIYAVEEADQLQHKEIDCGHLMLGLLRLEPSAAGELLLPFGIGYDSVKAIVAALPETALKKEGEPSGPVHPLSRFVSGAARHLEFLREAEAHEKLKAGPSTRKQAMGHLIDYATAHHQWISRAMVEPRVVAAGYPDLDRAAAQNYTRIRWMQLIHLWTGLNHLLGHVILQVPEESRQTPCKIGVADEIPLQTLIERYVAYTQGLMAQILTRD
jgi:hypothetical protein